MFYETWFRFAGGNFRANGKKAFIEHYDAIRALVPPDRLLEYHVKDGWGPLCEFLELDCPQESFPSGNDTGDFKSLVRRLDWMRVREAVQQNALSLAAVLAVMTGMGLASWWKVVACRHGK